MRPMACLIWFYALLALMMPVHSCGAAHALFGAGGHRIDGAFDWVTAAWRSGVCAADAVRSRTAMQSVLTIVSTNAHTAFAVAASRFA